MRLLGWLKLSAAVVAVYIGGRMLLTPADLPDRTLDLQHPSVAARNWRWLVAVASLRDNSGVVHGAVMSLCQVAGARSGERSVRVGDTVVHYPSSLRIRFTPPFRTSSGVRQVYELGRDATSPLLLTASPAHFPWHDPKLATLVAPRCATEGATVVVVNARTQRIVLRGILPAYKTVPEFRSNGLLNIPPWPAELPLDPDL